MPSITITVTAAEAARINAALAANGFPDAKTFIVFSVKNMVAAFEQQQAVSAIVPPTPITPT